MSSITDFYVRYYEIDSLGIVHHSVYALWFEAGRADFMKKAGASVHKLKSSGLSLPLTELRCAYKHPARFGDKIKIVTSLSHMSYVKVRFSYQVFNESSGILIASGMTSHAWVNKKIEPVNIEKAAPDVYQKLVALVKPS